MYETGRPTHADPTAVASRTDLTRFLDVLLADFRAGGEQEWENGTLDRFLEGLSAHAYAVEDSTEPLTWQTVAKLGSPDVHVGS